MSFKYNQLTDKERYSLEILLQEKYSRKAISEKLNRSQSTISRELRRNRIDGLYNADRAISLATARRFHKRHKTLSDPAKDKIEEKLSEGWSPEQISYYLGREELAEVSHEYIYQYIDKDKKNGGQLYLLLPSRGRKYKKRNLKTRPKVWKQAVKRKSITERPDKEILKKVTGHWEGDTVESKGHRGGIATIVDLKSKFTIIRKVKDKTAEEMKNAINNAFIKCPDLIKTLTLDNGNEFAMHDKIATDLNADVYFADPYSPWQRGLNENTNGLIRRFYPKGTDFTLISERELLKVQTRLNNRPRKTLGYRTPKEVFIENLLQEKKYTEMIQVI